MAWLGYVAVKEAGEGKGKGKNEKKKKKFYVCTYVLAKLDWVRLIIVRSRRFTRFWTSFIIPLFLSFYSLDI